MMNDELKKAQQQAMLTTMLELRGRTGDDYVSSWQLVVALYDAAIKVLDPRNDAPASFANEPETITALRATRDGARYQTVRDTLIDALRDFDRAEVFKDSTDLPTCIFIVAGRVRADSGTMTTYYHRSDDRYQLRGLIEEGKQRLLAQDYNLA